MRATLYGIHSVDFQDIRFNWGQSLLSEKADKPRNNI